MQDQIIAFDYGLVNCDGTNWETSVFQSIHFYFKTTENRQWHFIISKRVVD